MRVSLTLAALMLALACPAGCRRSPSPPGASAPVAARETEKPEAGAEVGAPVESDSPGETQSGAPTVADDVLIEGGAAGASPSVRVAVVGEVGSGGEVAFASADFVERRVDALREALDSDDPAARRAAAVALGDLRDAAFPAAGDLAAALQDKNAAVRGAAAEALGKIGRRDETVEAALVELIDREEDDQVLGAALEALGAVGIPPDADPAPLLRALESEDERVRREAAWLLGELAPRDADLDQVTAALIGAISNDYGRVRENAYGSLGHLGKGRPQVTLALIPLLESEDGDLRYRAAYALSLIGPDARAAVPTLFEMIRREQDEQTRTEAIRVLREIDPQAAKGFSTPPDES